MKAFLHTYCTYLRGKWHPKNLEIGHLTGCTMLTSVEIIFVIPHKDISRNRVHCPSCCLFENRVQKVIGASNESGECLVPIPCVLYSGPFHSCIVNGPWAGTHQGGFIRRQKGR